MDTTKLLAWGSAACLVTLAIAGTVIPSSPEERRRDAEERSVYQCKRDNDHLNGTYVAKAKSLFIETDGRMFKFDAAKNEILVQTLANGSFIYKELPNPTPEERGVLKVVESCVAKAEAAAPK